MDLLNPKLYQGLVDEFERGRHKVKVERAGDPGQWEYVHADGRLVLNRVLKGEEYTINCPYCGDQGHRLSISYRWGTRDPSTESRNLYLAHCYNEDCLSDPARRRNLYDRIFMLQHVGDLSHLVDDWNAAKSKRKAGQVYMPGTLWRVDSLARKDPDNPAIQYLRRRLISPEYVGSLWGVGFCPQSRFRNADQRIVVPVYFKGKCRGWTARAIYGEKPKWAHMSDMQRESLIYNFDQMQDSPVKVMVEGPGSVWGVGSMAGGILGKKFTEEQVKILKECVGPEDVVILMLDPKKTKDDIEKNRPHHMLVALERLKQERFGSRVVPVWLPRTMDPGDADRAFLFALIRRVAAEHGFTNLVLRD